MQVVRYHSTTIHPANIRLCGHCKPIIFQVFFSAYANDCVGDYEPDYFAFDFADNGYGKFIAELKEAAEEDERMDDIYNATYIETRDIREVERELVSLIPSQPDRTVQTSYIYDHCAKGNEYFHQQDYDKAIEHYRAAANLQWNGDVAFCLSLSYYLKGDYSNAVAAANRYNGSAYMLPTFSRGMSTLVLETAPIDKLNYLLERCMAS